MCDFCLRNINTCGIAFLSSKAFSPGGWCTADSTYLCQLNFPKVLLPRGAWVAQSVKRLTSAQVMVSHSVSSSPALGSVPSVQSLELASGSVSPSLSAPPQLALCVSLKKWISVKNFKVLLPGTHDHYTYRYRITYACAHARTHTYALWPGITFGDLALSLDYRSVWWPCRAFSGTPCFIMVLMTLFCSRSIIRLPHQTESW